MWRWVKLPKAVALLAFFLPWMTVSCADHAFATGTGFGLVSGHLTFVGDLHQTDEDFAQALDPWLVLAIAAIVLGLIASFLKVRRGAPVVIGSAVAAAALIWIGTVRYSRTALLETAARRSGEHAADAATVAMIQVHWLFGFWLALAALAVATVTVWLAWTRRDRRTLR